MESFFTRLGNMILGEAEEETELEKQQRLRQYTKLEMLAKSKRSVLLEDLEHSIQALQLFLSGKTTANGMAKRLSMDLTHEGQDSDSTPAQAAMMESTDDQKNLLLNDALPVVNTLCMHIDRCMTHGLRPVEKDEEATVKFFGVVKWTCTRVEAIRQKQLLTAMHRASVSGERNVCEVVTSSVEPDLPRHIRGFFGAVRSTSSLTNVNTDEGKARAFVRQALNMHLLQSCMSMILSETNMDLLASYYTEFALFRQRDEVKMFLSMLSGLDELSFAFVIDDPRLDLSPDSFPFLKPLPRPKAQKIKKVAPKLIDPEDMVGGRVRLCEEDHDTTLLAEKLVSYHEIRSAFNSLKGGNPLSDVLKQAAKTQKIEDAATAVLRFLELGYPVYDVFGTDLFDVLCNPFLSGMARFETAMGIPDVVEACFCYLYEHLDSPGLFQVHLEADHVIELRDTIEELGGFHKQMAVDPHEVTAILFQYLWELPDSILTEERLENFLVCGGRADNGMNEEEKIMLLQVLVNDLPWSSKPTLERLCHLIMTALEPVYAEKNGLTLYSVANTFAPLLLRKKHGSRFHEYEDASYRKYPVGYQRSSSVRYRLIPSEDEYPFSEKQRLATEKRMVRHATRDAEESSYVLKLLFSNHMQILSDFRQELVVRRAKMQEKVLCLETIRYKMEEPIDITNSNHVTLLKRLWKVLLLAEQEELALMDSDNLSTLDIEAVLASERWKASGFHTESPLGGFRGGGLLSLECLVFFIEEYPEKAKAMMERNAVAGGNRYPFPVASINVMRMMMKLLMLDEAPDTCSKLVLHSADPTIPTTVLKMRIAERVSRTPFWKIFDDPNAFYKLHSMAFMLLDLHWIHSGATQMGFQPVLDSTRRQMGWLLEQAPQTVDDMWTKWMEAREQHAAMHSPGIADEMLTASLSSSSSSISSMMSDLLVEQKSPAPSTSLQENMMLDEMDHVVKKEQPTTALKAAITEPTELEQAY